MTNKKKVALGTAVTIAAISAPVAVAVSCGSKETTNQTKENKINKNSKGMQQEKITFIGIDGKGTIERSTLPKYKSIKVTVKYTKHNLTRSFTNLPKNLSNGDEVKIELIDNNGGASTQELVVKGLKKNSIIKNSNNIKYDLSTLTTKFSGDDGKGKMEPLKSAQHLKIVYKVLYGNVNKPSLKELSTPPTDLSIGDTVIVNIVPEQGYKVNSKNKEVLTYSVNGLVFHHVHKDFFGWDNKNKVFNIDLRKIKDNDSNLSNIKKVIMAVQHEVYKPAFIENKNNEIEKLGDKIKDGYINEYKKKNIDISFMYKKVKGAWKLTSELVEPSYDTDSLTHWLRINKSETLKFLKTLGIEESDISNLNAPDGQVGPMRKSIKDSQKEQKLTAEMQRISNIEPMSSPMAFIDTIAPIIGKNIPTKPEELLKLQLIDEQGTTHIQYITGQKLKTFIAIVGALESVVRQWELNTDKKFWNLKTQKYESPKNIDEMVESLIWTIDEQSRGVLAKMMEYTIVNGKVERKKDSNGQDIQTTSFIDRSISYPLIKKLAKMGILSLKLNKPAPSVNDSTNAIY